MFPHKRESKQNKRLTAACQRLGHGEPTSRCDLLIASGLLESKWRAEVRVTAAAAQASKRRVEWLHSMRSAMESQRLAPTS